MLIKQLISIFVICGTAVVAHDMCANFIMKKKWDYRGDYSGIAMVRSTYADCCAECSKDNKCNAFTWTPYSKLCWLHPSIDHGGVSNSTTHVGLRRNFISSYRYSNNSSLNSSIGDGEVHTPLVRVRRAGGSICPTRYLCNPNASCGCPSKSILISRVVQGEPASDWGWPVYIKWPNNFCGGSIISATWILTAAHCVKGINESQITVYAGSKKAASGSQILTVSRVIIHRAYDELDHGVLINDIALLRLSTPLNMTDPRVSAICIPSVNSAALSSSEWPTAGTTVVAVGWGRLRENGATASTLQQVTLQTIHHKSPKCTPFSNSTVQFCAFAPGKDTCNGDSGGPLMAFTTSNQWILVGVTSYGIGCARPDKAGIYTRIAAFQTWIKSNTNDQFTYPISSSLVRATTVATGRFFSSMSGPVHVPARNMLHFSYQ